MKFAPLLCLLGLTLLTPVATADMATGVRALKVGDNVTALREFTQSAEKGNAQAQYALGVMYQRGKGVPADERVAAQWFTKASTQGLPNAQYALGMQYREGRGVERDDKQAGSWLTRAAKQGFAPAQYELAEMYRMGIGVAQNTEKAAAWYGSAAEQGDKRAHAALKKLDQKSGPGVMKTLMMDDIRKDALSGGLNSQLLMGQIFSTGIGVKVDEREAAKWFGMAAAQGDASAKEWLKAHPTPPAGGKTVSQ